jgi:hypothetical protein
MGYLILHIDLNYISGVIISNISDEIYSLKTTDNRDPERFWLFFENDQYNHRIKYKKENRQKVYDKKPDFIGDIMLRGLKDETFLLNDQNYELLELLEHAGILSGIKTQFFDITGSDVINTMLIFSDNIPLPNKEIFSDFLSKKGFLIETFNISLPELISYYHANKKEKVNLAKAIFVIDAYNDNLNLSVLYNAENFYNRLQSNFHTYPNMGKDPKQKIIVEYVVDSLAHETCFLKSKERKETEYKRQQKNAEDWLNRLALVETLILQDVTLANCAKTKYTIAIERSEIERRTQKYFTDVITKYRVLNNQVKAKEDFIVLLSGETLSNSLMKKRFIEEVGESKLRIIENIALKNVYALYPEVWEKAKIQLSKNEREKRYELLISEGEELFNASQFEEAQGRYYYARDIKNTEEVNKLINDIEIAVSKEKKNKQDFDSLVSKSENLVKQNKLSEAKLCLEKALEIFPEESRAINTLKDIMTLISIANQNIKDSFKKAEGEYSKENWQKARDLFKTILNIQPDNRIAIERIENCNRYISLGPIIKKADNHFLKQEYKDALFEYKRGKEDKYCSKKSEECDIIIKNQREIRNLEIESKSLQANKKLQRLEDRYVELVELVNKIQIADPTNKQSDEILKTYWKGILELKNVNETEIYSDKRILEKGKKIISVPVSSSKETKTNRKGTEIPPTFKGEQKKKRIIDSGNDIKSESERLFLTGRFVEAKHLFEMEQSSDTIKDRIMHCIELRKHEQLIKGVLRESFIINEKQDKEKAKNRLIEIAQIDIVYSHFNIVDDRISQIKENLNSIK